MNRKRNIILLFLILAASFASAQNAIVQRIYAYGFSASFQDSIVYFTEIQQIDSAYIQPKTKFLDSRESYSYQLRDYFAGQGDKNRTCIIVFALERKDIEKKYLKMKNKYIKSGDFDIRYLTKEQFQFTAVSPTQIIEDESSDKPVKEKKKKKNK